METVEAVEHRMVEEEQHPNKETEEKESGTMKNVETVGVRCFLESKQQYQWDQKHTFNQQVK
jgi:hypothetical protein